MLNGLLTNTKLQTIYLVQFETESLFKNNY